ncbi:MAG: ABC transporter permease [Bacteroidota bacterium]|nr:ABC transporter permease [Bacteroidota bacterium]MDX5428739.1 ABC transporter permease [Bacteroidota bacterium]MDX5447147.1 ABC transporter permease [Bacteroidota bacterium]MDX5506465.1 ABC transporter permease [Bacteroidota bacterium]
MIKVIKYSLSDLLRNRWVWAYVLFFWATVFGLHYLRGDGGQVLVSLLNIIVLFVPLISLVFSLMYMYQVREFIELLLAQPVSRWSIFLGYYLGVTIALGLALVIGIGVPILLVGTGVAGDAWMTLIAVGVFETAIFAAIACSLVVRNDNRLIGFGMGLMIWVFMAILYDGIVLLTMVLFEEYRLEGWALAAMTLNPIDMGRVLVMFRMDYSALLGFTGAVFQRFFGTFSGSIVLIGAFFVWVGVPVWILRRRTLKKDF